MLSLFKHHPFGPSEAAREAVEALLCMRGLCAVVQALPAAAADPESLAKHQMWGLDITSAAARCNWPSGEVARPQVAAWSDVRTGECYGWAIAPADASGPSLGLVAFDDATAKQRWRPSEAFLFSPEEVAIERGGAPAYRAADDTTLLGMLTLAGVTWLWSQERASLPIRASRACRRAAKKLSRVLPGTPANAAKRFERAERPFDLVELVDQLRADFEQRNAIARLTPSQPEGWEPVPVGGPADPSYRIDAAQAARLITAGYWSESIALAAESAAGGVEQARVAPGVPRDANGAF